ncbi:3-isopropylmalate dehydratase small subunit [Leptospira wolffii]|uniref:3-isopropylmalate dehydratase small subunit n=1 Tax=Leptospira wolffii TaxID=409998 RepID=A0ABV5BLZ9_9LEPT|nr:3-isopropylmalate dehydratase small subunit [Leptospira wolffii]TGL49920.1 3-isopropylmalate dehydratase small subunit [Leptospira wolffii]
MNTKVWTTHTGVAAYIPRADIDTDQILPKQFMKKVEKTGFGKHLFHDWRYLDAEGTVSNPEFILNRKEYEGASVLVAGENFGCGSSREHAPWALADFGIRAILAPSFADIFSLNSPKNGIALVRLSQTEISDLVHWLEKNPGERIRVDLENGKVQAGEKNFSFFLDSNSTDRIRFGWDDIDLTLQETAKIRAFQERYAAERPFLSVNW